MLKVEYLEKMEYEQINRTCKKKVFAYDDFFSGIDSNPFSVEDGTDFEIEIYFDIDEDFFNISYIVYNGYDITDICDLKKVEKFLRDNK